MAPERQGTARGTYLLISPKRLQVVGTYSALRARTSGESSAGTVGGLAASVVADAAASTAAAFFFAAGAGVPAFFAVGAAVLPLATGLAVLPLLTDEVDDADGTFVDGTFAYD
mgnify:CR=1 FL=1